MAYTLMVPDSLVTLTNAADEALAISETVAQLLKHAGRAKIRGGFLYNTVGYDSAKLQAALKSRLPGVPFIGSTSCRGVGTSGARFSTGKTLVGWWLLGDGFRFGVASEPKGGDPEQQGARLAARALEAGGFTADDCRFALFSCTPGDEEMLLAGAHERFKQQVPFIGGTAADDDLSGKWMLWTHELATGNGVALAVCDWPWKLAINYEPGYVPTKKRGRVTSSRGRTIVTIDGRPAAEVYNEWSNGALGPAFTSGGMVLSQTTLKPLGLPRAVFGGLEAFVLAHPERVNLPERSLSLFTRVKTGEEVVLMSSNEEALVRRSASVARNGLSRAGLQPSEIVGGLLVYCAGCMLALEKRMPAMLAEFEGAVGKIPYVACFSFGEQGTLLPRLVDHGNLMACTLLLSATPRL